jgi:hypothetical protein
VSATSKGEQPLRSRDDFQRFCADLRTSAPGLDELVEVLRALATSGLRPTERGRFARVIARHLGASFQVADVRAVAAREAWPTEIAMALRSQAPAEGEPPVRGADPPPDPVSERPAGADMRELSRERGSPLTVVFLGDEGEHRASIDRLQGMGMHCQRESSVSALGDVFVREAVVGLVVGATWWTAEGAGQPSPRQCLRRILALSNLCWIKLVRSSAWAPEEGRLTELCMSLHLAPPPRDRLAVEDRATLTDAELRSLAEAIRDLIYGERTFVYDVPPSPAQDRVLRAATARSLRSRYPTVHARESRLDVRTLAHRETHGLAGLVSVAGTDVAFVVKVSPYPDALEEAQRFRALAHGISFAMDFFCHGPHGALVFAPIRDTLGQPRSLEDMLAPRDLLGRRPAQTGCLPAIDAAIAALQRFSQQLQPEGVDMYCGVESDATGALLARCGPIAVAGEAVDLGRMYAYGLQALHRCASREAVQHGDAHPGNILFSATNTAVLIDYEGAGLGPACYDLSMLWIDVLASHFVAVGDERATVGLLRDLLQGVPFDVLEQTWADTLRFAASHEAVYLAHKAIEASVAAMTGRGCTREDVYGIVAIILCRELLNPRFQQLALRLRRR